MIDFFLEHIDNIEECENCGLDLRSKAAGKNVAHILPKRTFKSVAKHDKNVMYLCSTFDREDGKSGCHEMYDQNWSKAQSMPVWEVAKKRFLEFEDEIKETSKILFYFND